jgi:hypothetical protein
MKIDVDDYMTAAEVAEQMGTNKRGVYRARKRAEAKGHDVTAVILGKTFFLRKAVPLLVQFYYPYYSEAHQSMVKKWGATGGTQKKLNRQKGTEQ